MGILNNLTIRKKLVSAFIVVGLLFAGLILIIRGIIIDMNQTYGDLITASAQEVAIINQVEATFLDARRVATDIFLVAGWENIPQSRVIDTENALDQKQKDIISLLDTYRGLLKTPPGDLSQAEIYLLTSQGHTDTYLNNNKAALEAIDNIEVGVNGWFDILRRNFYTTGTGNRDTENISVFIEMASENITTLEQLKAESIVIEIAAVNSYIYIMRVIIAVVSIIILLILVLIAVVITSSITKSISHLENGVNEVLNGNFDVALRSNKKDEIGTLSNMVSDMVEVFNKLLIEIKENAAEIEKGEIDARINEAAFKGGYKDVAHAINQTINGLLQDTTHALNVVTEYANGNFDITIKRFPGKKAKMHESVDALKLNLQSVSKEIGSLVDAASEGDLRKRANTENYKGNWKELVKGLNELLENIEKPIEEAVIVLEEVAKGNLQVEVKGQYKGDFAKIKNSTNEALKAFLSYVTEISAVLGEMSNKNLDVEITREYLGDFNGIKESINNIVDTFNHVIDEINSSSIQVAAGASQISESSMELAHGSTRQSNSVEELNKNVNEILGQIQSNAENAENTSKLAIEAKESADIGNSDMKEMLVSMSEMNDASESISKIIKVIDDIAFQTNLLALNAAVEAARAGEYGKGFAVVAEEVRALAQRSKDAAAETNTLIETSIEKTNAGVLIANKTAETLNTIVSQVGEIAISIGGVADASKNQAVSAENINSGIIEVSQVTQITTSTSEEAASASQELSSQTEVFKGLVGQFNLKK